jgi:predicted ester cyclase
VHHDLGDNPSVGLAPLRVLLDEIKAALADVEIRVEDQVAEADKVVSRVTLAGTRRGLSEDGAGAGSRVRASGIDSVRLDDGKVVERWGLFGTWAQALDASTSTSTPPAPVASRG